VDLQNDATSAPPLVLKQGVWLSGVIADILVDVVTVQMGVLAVLAL
jgi:hypothetical protein